jgi:hypothetical protein
MRKDILRNFKTSSDQLDSFETEYFEMFDLHRFSHFFILCLLERFQNWFEVFLKISLLLE